MKKLFLILATSLTIVIICAFSLSNEVISKIGCTNDEANNTIFDNFIFGNLNVPYCNNIYKTIPEGERASIVNQLFDYIKSYVNSDAFKTKYKADHESMKPEEPKMEQIASTEDQNALLIKGMEEELNSPYIPEEQKAELKKNIEIMKQTLSSPEYKAQTANLSEIQQNAAKDEYNVRLAEYKTAIAEWEKMKDINTMLKIRLKAFLDLTSDIDFNAKLIKVNNKFHFENTEYQNKSSQWKMCFRSGKETIITARACATKWLKEL